MQTTYTDEPEIGYPGQPCDSGYKDDISRVAEEDIDPGLAVFRGTDPDNQARLPTSGDSTTAAILGVVVRHHHSFALSGSEPDTYPEGQPMAVRRIGRVKVRFEDAFDPSDSVFVRNQSGSGGTQPGAFRTTADTATAIAWTGARIMNSGGAGDIAILQILQG